MIGLIKKGIGGFYYVSTEKGIIQAKGRGIFKKNKITLCVGDIVDLEILDDGDGIINEIEPRKNQFIRPPIANVDCFFVVFAGKEPNPNYFNIDKFLIMAEANNTEVLICINKTDLLTVEERKEIEDIYKGVYPMTFISTVTGEGLDDLKTRCNGKKVALAGPSGVGKSTITNNLIPKANMETGVVSDKTKRGKHTTRHVEIFDLEDGGMIFDTPGFTSFEVLEVDEDELMDYYPEMAKLRGCCKYDNCRHVKEPACAIIDAVDNGVIHEKRYESYIHNLEEIKKKKRY